MFHHVANAGACAFQGEYFEACKWFAGTNESEMKLNNCTLDLLLKGSPTSYFDGVGLWRKAQECKRVMLNEIHSVFCQDVCPQWPSVPSETTTLDPLYPRETELA